MKTDRDCREEATIVVGNLGLSDRLEKFWQEYEGEASTDQMPVLEDLLYDGMVATIKHFNLDWESTIDPIWDNFVLSDTDPAIDSLLIDWNQWYNSSKPLDLDTRYINEFADWDSCLHN